MDHDLQHAIQQADNLIKQGEFDSAWQVLLPYQRELSARKRLLWLKQKRQEASKAAPAQQTKPNARRFPAGFLVVALIALGLIIVLLYGLAQRESTPPSVVQAAPQPTSVATESEQTILAVTEAAPIENPSEVSLQDQIRAWFVTVEGVEQVLSLDIDVPENDPPLVFAEIVVDAGYNDTRIPDKLVEILNEELDTADYSDFLIILTDASQVVEYTLDSENIEWQQNVLSSPLSTPDSSL